ncbi:MAG TPA: hypothetical protein VLL72_07780, partial [Kiloniellales bacterium]|nr:hypothetical protein [Kiloniellales bacterium]
RRPSFDPPRKRRRILGRRPRRLDSAYIHTNPSQSKMVEDLLLIAVIFKMVAIILKLYLEPKVENLSGPSRAQRRNSNGGKCRPFCLGRRPTGAR